VSEAEKDKPAVLEVEEASPEAKAFWDRLGKERTAEFMKDLENLMKSDTLEHNGETFKFNPVKGKDIIKFKKLDTESFKIDDKDSENWYNNVKERACIVIEGMTPEKVDNGDWVIIENMVTAWSSRALRGFHRAKPRL
jgi:hypothetical protein